MDWIGSDWIGWNSSISAHNTFLMKQSTQWTLKLLQKSIKNRIKKLYCGKFEQSAQEMHINNTLLIVFFSLRSMLVLSVYAFWIVFPAHCLLRILQTLAAYFPFSWSGAVAHWCWIAIKARKSSYCGFRHFSAVVAIATIFFNVHTL